VHDAIAAKAKEFSDVVKIGAPICRTRSRYIRTGIRRLGQPAGRDIKRLQQALDGLYDLAIGGTAVGTG
jgi:fumarate hydratase class II